ncbi:hydroxyacylglutathione hydrolase [Aestuariibius sp. 2305UL40-4]|uniref:hydroxyacylglutathione hydrolase n=1 Tax=Aestuariibius violaceus TaxID=3234132 RepID=UPI00345E0707
MPLHILTVPCLSDNYAYILHDDVTRRTALVDAPEVEPIREVLVGHGWELSDLLITHHHPDHIDGVEELHRIYDCRVIGAQADQKRLPPLDIAVGETDVEAVAGEEVHILDVPGHTIGHIAFYMPGAQALFSADSLMSCGCGRLFEGTPAQMWESLLKMRKLPDDTTVYSGHEYTETNIRFALTLEPDSDALISRQRTAEALRADDKPTVPVSLAEEKRTNPFLRADDPTLKEAIGMADASDVEVFAEIRKRRDNF